MTESDKPMVSVIMPVYNGSTWIGESIRSVMAQSYGHIELLVINDGSEDNTEELVLEFIQLDARIRYFKQENKGVSAARNFGLRTMQGAFFTFVDADDCLTRESIGSRMLKFEMDNSLSFCDGGVTVFDHLLKMPRRTWKPTVNGFVFKRLVGLSESCFFGPTWLIRRDFSQTYSFQEDMTHAEDLFFFIEISKSGKYDFVDQDILKYRTSPNSAMRNLKALANGYIILFEKVLERFGNDITFREKIYLWMKIRLITVLSFLSEGYFRNAFFFLLTGRAK
jgi:teichuronic acid biosynthesis glycosyltransferase TuaG